MSASQGDVNLAMNRDEEDEGVDARGHRQTDLGGNPRDMEGAEVVPKVRSRWIKFEGDQGTSLANSADEIAISLDVASASPGVATIEPSQSVQVSKDPLSESITSFPTPAPRLSPPPPVTRTSVNITQPAAAVHSINPRGQSIGQNNVGPMSNQVASPSLQSIALKEVTATTAASPSSPTSPQSFKNGDILVTLLPLNAHCAWITPANYKPELVPEELMAQNLSLTVEDYVTAMQVLVNDLRFNLYVMLYKRILVIWIALGFVVLLSILFSGVKGLALFGGGVLWLIINAMGIFVSMWVKLKIYHMLERSLADVNQMFYKSNILLGVDDKGKLSCHKINLVFIYFDTSYCIKYLKDMLENEGNPRESSASSPATSSSLSLPPLDLTRMDIDAEDVIITGSTQTRLPQKEKFAEKLLLRYSQRWVKEFVRQRIGLNLPIHGDASTEGPVSLSPRHCPTSRCPCQYIEEHLRFKPLTKCSITELFL